MDPRVIVKEEDEVFCCDDPEYPLINTADHSLNDRTRASDIVTLKVDPNTMCIKVEPCIADHEFKTEFSDTELKEELLPPNIEQAEVKTDEIFESLSDCEKEEEHDSMDKKQPSPTSTNSKQARKHQSDSRKTLNNTQFYICHECGHKSKQKTALKLHMLTHMDPAHVTWYKCELCPYASKLKGGLNVHMLSHKTITENVSNAEHKNEINGPVESQEKARGYVLLSSNSTFSETESDDDTANNEYINRSDLDFDISPRDQAKKQRYLSEQPIRCNFCDKDVTPKDFSRHVEPCHETKIEVRNILRSPKNSKRRMHAFGLLGNESGNICSYINCRNTRRNNLSISAFYFPIKDEARCKIWITNSGNAKLGKMSPSSLKKRFLCSEHFPDEIYGYYGKLPRHAVPFKYSDERDLPLRFHQDLHRNVYPPSKKLKVVPYVSLPSTSTTSTDTSIIDEPI